MRQLQDGIRLFDIKVGKSVTNPADPIIYSVHTFLGPQLDSIIDQFAQFFEQTETKSELVVIRLHEFYGFGPSDHTAAQNMISSKLGSRLLTRTGSTESEAVEAFAGSTLSSLVERREYCYFV